MNEGTTYYLRRDKNVEVFLLNNKSPERNIRRISTTLISKMNNKEKKEIKVFDY